MIQRTGEPRHMRGSRKRAIEQHCKECIYDQKGGTGTWREQTQNCTATQCALWPFRPKPTKTLGSAEKSLSVREEGEFTTTARRIRAQPASPAKTGDHSNS